MTKKSPSKKTAKPSKTPKKEPKHQKTDLTLKQKETLSILNEIENEVKNDSRRIIVYSSHSPDFMSYYYVIAKLTNLEVCKVNNNSAFMPHETRERKDFCILYILQIGNEVKEDEGLIKELKRVGCPVYKITSLYGVRQVFSELD